MLIRLYPSTTPLKWVYFAENKLDPIAQVGADCPQTIRRGHGKLPKIRDFDIAIEYTIVYVLARPNFVRPNMTVAKL